MINRILIYLFISITLLFVGHTAQTQDTRSVINISKKDLSKQQISLDGPWMFCPFILLSEGEDVREAELVQMPHMWNHSEASLGFASYRALIVIPQQEIFKSLSLRMPDVYTSYQLFVDGKKIGSNGTVSIIADEAIPEWVPKTLQFIPERDTVELILQIANFHHYRGGINKLIYLGETGYINSRVHLNFILGIALFILLAVLVLVSFIFSHLYQDRVLLFFALLCLSWSFRTIFSNDYLAVQCFPALDWNWVVRIEYITLYMSTLFGLLFIVQLFPKDFHIVVTMVYVAVSIIFSVFTLSVPPVLFTRYVHLYLLFSGLLLTAIVFVVIKAFILNRSGANYMLSCILFGAFLYGYVILAYMNLIEFYETIFNIGFITLFIVIGIWVLKRPMLHINNPYKR